MSSLPPDPTFVARCKSLVVDLGLGSRDAAISVRTLTGGVASDIGVVTLGKRQFCVKFALAKLRVAADWAAPVHRNKAEYAWLKIAHSVAPKNAPELLGWSAKENGFAMEFLAGDTVYLWKDALLAGALPRDEARKTARVLGRIHQASTEAGFDTSAFDNRDDFKALRIEPYLSFTAKSHPDISNFINGMAEELYKSDQVLVHGDVSPKNILMRDAEPVILDAECATMGDAYFDVAFALNHLILKSVHRPDRAHAYLPEAELFWETYRGFVTWENPDDLEKRVARLLPMLMLGRVDGKSPVEYLAAPQQGLVRNLARAAIMNPPADLHSLFVQLAQGISD